VKEWGEKIIFLRKIMEGGTSRSYGIEVARIAGVPKEVITRAKEILRNLEKGEFDEIGMPVLSGEPVKEKMQVPIKSFCEKESAIARENKNEEIVT